MCLRTPRQPRHYSVQRVEYGWGARLRRGGGRGDRADGGGRIEAYRRAEWIGWCGDDQLLRRAGEDLGKQLDGPGERAIALNKLNLAMRNVAALDGYIGAQINRLNSISQVMSTRHEENVVSAQNPMKRRTGTLEVRDSEPTLGRASASQADSVEQEVTKLFQ